MNIIRNQQIVGNGLNFQGIQSGGTVSNLIGISTGNKVALDSGEIGILYGSSASSYQMAQYGISTDANAGEFVLTRLHNANGDGTFNEILNLGYNIAFGGGRLESTDTALAISFEGRYITGGVGITEWHLLYVDTGGTQRRPWSWTIRKDDWSAAGGDSVILDTRASEMHWYKPAGGGTSEYMTITPNSFDFQPGGFSNQMRIQGDAFNMQMVAQSGTPEIQFLAWTSVRVASSVTNGLLVGDGAAGASPCVKIQSGAVTAAQYMQFANTGGLYFFGANNSAGNALETTSAYAFVLSLPASRDFYLTQDGLVAIKCIASGARVFLKAPNSAPTDGDLVNGSITFHLDQTGHNLLVRAKYSDASLRTATIALV